MPKRNYSRRNVVCFPNPWRAQIRYRDTEVYLGAFPTWEEALAAENQYRERKGIPAYNPLRNTNGAA